MKEYLRNLCYIFIVIAIALAIGKPLSSIYPSRSKEQSKIHPYEDLLNDDRPRPDGVQSPILGFVPNHPHIATATGHYRNGIMMAPVTAQITRDLLLTGTSDLPWKPFSL